MPSGEESVTNSEGEVARFALQEGIRAIEEQTAEVGRIRDRLVMLVGLISAATAFLVGAALESSTRGLRFYVPLAVGTVTFVLLIVLGWLILKPMKPWRSAVGPTVIIEDFRGPSAWHQLAGFYEQAFNRNEEQLAPLRTRMQQSLVVAGAIIVCWIVLIWLVAA